MSVFRMAVDFYTAKCEKTDSGHTILSNAARQMTAEMLHDENATWYDNFNLDDIERYIFYSEKS